MTSLKGDDCLHGIIEGGRELRLISRVEEGIVDGESILMIGNTLLCGVNIIAKLIYLKVGFSFMGTVFRVVAKGSREGCFVELLTLVHHLHCFIIKIIDLIGLIY